MEWKDIGKGLLSVAPTIAAALGGPVGMIAGGAIKMLTNMLGLPEGSSAQTVSDELQKYGPEDYYKLRELDATFNQHLLDAGVKLEEIVAQDKQSARAMQIELRSLTPDLLAGVVTVGFFGLLYCLMYTTVAPEAQTMLNILLGALATAWVQVISFYFGSSNGSDKLKDMLGAKK